MNRTTRRVLPVLALLGISFHPDSAPAAPASPAEIVMVGRVPHEKGHLRCGLYDRAGWLKRPLQSAESVPAGLRGVCRFRPLAPGAYALGAYLDENDNGDLDRDFMGFPSEPYGVSNGARIRFLTAPSFDAAKVEYRGQALMVQLRIE